MVDVKPSPRRNRHGARDRLMLESRVVEVERVAPRFRRLRLSSAAFRTMRFVPGQEVRVRVDAETSTWLMGRRRTYSVWRHGDDWIDLIVFLHGEGPGTTWARDAAVGDEVLVTRPRGTLVMREAGFHLLIGEETASVPIASMLSSQHTGEATCVLEVDSPEDRWPVAGDVRWLCRNGRSAAASQSLVDALRDLPLPSSDAVAYVAGEAHTVQLVRTHLVSERGWRRRNVVTKPFWTPGKTGLE